MPREVYYRGAVREYLETNPHAEELRVLIACLVRGDVPLAAVTGIDDQGLTMYALEDSGCHVWWHYENDGEIVIVDGIG